MTMIKYGSHRTGRIIARCGLYDHQLDCPTMHGTVVPVDAGGETVAHLCTDCDTQLPADWERPDVSHGHRQVIEVSAGERFESIECANRSRT